MIPLMIVGQSEIAEWIRVAGPVVSGFNGPSA
jgi:hypothetical protein